MGSAKGSFGRASGVKWRAPPGVGGAGRFSGLEVGENGWEEEGRGDACRVRGVDRESPSSRRSVEGLWEEEREGVT